MGVGGRRSEPRGSFLKTVRGQEDRGGQGNLRTANRDTAPTGLQGGGGGSSSKGQTPSSNDFSFFTWLCYVSNFVTQNFPRRNHFLLSQQELHFLKA